VEQNQWLYFSSILCGRDLAAPATKYAKDVYLMEVKKPLKRTEM
jgi:hypothetical protein